MQAVLPGSGMAGRTDFLKQKEDAQIAETCGKEVSRQVIC